MTHDQFGACIALEKEGLHAVRLPIDENTPVPGLQLYADIGHRQLLLVQGDGTVVDLLEVHRRAEECIRNWGVDSFLPGFVGDFTRLTPLAVALNGRKVQP
jgi:hypothetical protein